MIQNIVDGMSVLSGILIVAGFILIGIEMVMPGISLPGILGTIFLILSVFLVADTLVEGIIITIVILVILAIMFGIALWLLSKGKLVKPVILTDEQTKENGYLSASDLNHLIGKQGITTTDLRPSGIGNFEAMKLDIISEGSYIEKDTVVIISEVKGSRLVVKPIKIDNLKRD